MTAGSGVHRTNGASGRGGRVDGVFMEVHERPGQAKSDAQNALRLDRLEPLLRDLTRIHAIATASIGSLTGVPNSG